MTGHRRKFKKHHELEKEFGAAKPGGDNTMKKERVLNTHEEHKKTEVNHKTSCSSCSSWLEIHFITF